MKCWQCKKEVSTFGYTLEDREGAFCCSRVCAADYRAEHETQLDRIEAKLDKLLLAQAEELDGYECSNCGDWMEKGRSACCCTDAFSREYQVVPTEEYKNKQANNVLSIVNAAKERDNPAIE